MIVSASRRTDIPAFYSDWFFNRLRDGFAWVRNPMNPRQVSEIPLTPRSVDCFVFWTKNPAPMLARHADELVKMATPFYFHITITPYGRSIEPAVARKEEVLSSFAALARLVGRERVIWRYDPIIFTDTIDIAYHLKHFTDIAEFLAPHPDKCVISFLDIYRKIQHNMREIGAFDPPEEAKHELCRKLHSVATQAGMQIAACAEAADFSADGITRNRCIDPDLIARLCGETLSIPKDKHQRKECLCAESVDIGAYNSCAHLCRYCYANADRARVEANAAEHDPGYPMLFGKMAENDRLYKRELRSCTPCLKGMF